MGALAKLSPGERLVLIAGVLLIADLLFVPWHSVDLGGLEIDFDTTRTAVESPNGGYGVAAVVLTLLMILQIVVSKLIGARLPSLRVPWEQLQLVAGVFVAVVLVIKLVRETELLGFGSYSGVLAGLLVAYGGYVISREGADAA